MPSPKTFCPPALPNVVASYPDRTLLTIRGYIADRKNATTATSHTSDGYLIQATFVAAEPPALSHICVHCPEAPSFLFPPGVVATQGNIILLDVSIGSTSDYFVYSVNGNGGASLDLLPDPGHSINRAYVGLVPSRPGGGGGYAVVTLSPDWGSLRFELSLHHEKTGLWRSKMVPRKPSLEELADGNRLKPRPFAPTKVIWLQGSTIAWVDIHKAVVLCDVLDNEDPVAHYIPLPEPLSDKNREALESCADPTFFRDVIGKEGSIKFVEMDYHYDPCSVPSGWKAVTCSWTIGSEGWRTDSVVDFTDVSKNSADLLSSLCSDTVALKNLPLFYPTLCERNNVLYLMSKPNRRQPKGSVVAVDTSKKAVEAVAPMSEERVIGYTLTYTLCTSSRHFKCLADIKPKVKDRTNNSFVDRYIKRDEFSKALDMDYGGPSELFKLHDNEQIPVTKSCGAMAIEEIVNYVLLQHENRKSWAGNLDITKFRVRKWINSLEFYISVAPESEYSYENMRKDLGAVSDSLILWFRLDGGLSELPCFFGQLENSLKNIPGRVGYASGSYAYLTRRYRRYLRKHISFFHSLSRSGLIDGFIKAYDTMSGQERYKFQNILNKTFKSSIIDTWFDQIRSNPDLSTIYYG